MVSCIAYSMLPMQVDDEGNFSKLSREEWVAKFGSDDDFDK